VLENVARLRLEGFSLGLTYPASVDTVAKVPGVFTDLRFPAALAGKEDMQQLQQLLGFAREAHLRTCAQGVERVAQWETLENLGCKSASGPLIAPAMHLDQAVEWALLRLRQLR
jgi:predicted signal transduction protein with EAL and GGDEF domain